MACTIDSLVHEAVATLDEDATVQQAAELMTRRNVSSLLVTRHGEVIGLFTERDLLRRVIGARRDPGDLCLGDVCTRSLVSISYESSCGQAIEKMQKGFEQKASRTTLDRFFG